MEASTESLRLAKAAGVKMAYGTDLLVIDDGPLTAGVDLLAELDRHLTLIVKDGVFIKDELNR